MVSWKRHKHGEIVDNVPVETGKIIDGVDISAHDVATTGVHGVGGNTVEHTGNKGGVDGYAPLGADSKVPDANSQVPSTYPFDKFITEIPRVSLDGFTPGGAGTVTAYGTTFGFSTGAVSGNYANVYSSEYFVKPIVTDKKLVCEWVIYYVSSNTAHTIWMRLSEGAGATPPSETENHLGFKIIDGLIYASNADGTTQQLTTTTMSLTAATYVLTRLRIELNPGVDCKFYVDGVLKVTHGANLPSMEYLYLDETNYTGDKTGKTLDLGRFLLARQS